jgi:hypothetical protein
MGEFRAMVPGSLRWPSFEILFQEILSRSCRSGPSSKPDPARSTVATAPAGRERPLAAGRQPRSLTVPFPAPGRAHAPGLSPGSELPPPVPFSEQKSRYYVKVNN